MSNVPEIWVNGRSRSLKLAPHDRLHMYSNWRSTVAMALSCIIS